IGRVFRKNSPQVLDVQRDQMIGALAPDRANQAFNITILPRRAERGGPVPDPHGSHASLKSNPKCSVVAGRRDADVLLDRNVGPRHLGSEHHSKISSARPDSGNGLSFFSRLPDDAPAGVAWPPNRRMPLPRLSGRL